MPSPLPVIQEGIGVPAAPPSGGVGGRRGFTAVELVVVLAAASILTAMAVTAALPAIRRGRLNDAAGAIEQVWREARFLAMTTRPAGPNPMPVDYHPKHYGVMIKQDGPGNTFVGLIWSASSAGAVLGDPDTHLLHHDPGDTATPFRRRIMISPSMALAWSTGSGAPAVSDGGGLVWYAQYRTGAPITADDVASGLGGSAVPLSVGVPANVYVSRSVATSFRVQTRDWQPSPRQGLAMAMSIYQVGIVAKEEL